MQPSGQTFASATSPNNRTHTRTSANARCMDAAKSNTPSALSRWPLTYPHLAPAARNLASGAEPVYRVADVLPAVTTPLEPLFELMRIDLCGHFGKPRDSKGAFARRCCDAASGGYPGGLFGGLDGIVHLRLVASSTSSIDKGRLKRATVLRRSCVVHVDGDRHPSSAAMLCLPATQTVVADPIDRCRTPLRPDDPTESSTRLEVRWRARHDWRDCARATVRGQEIDGRSQARDCFRSRAGTRGNVLLSCC